MPIELTSACSQHLPITTVQTAAQLADKPFLLRPLCIHILISLCIAVVHVLVERGDFLQIQLLGVGAG